MKKYSTISDKVTAGIKKELDSKPVYNKCFWKPKQNLALMKLQIKNKESHDKEIFKAGSNHTFLAVITIDSALKKEENYYPQVFLK